LVYTSVTSQKDTKWKREPVLRVSTPKPRKPDQPSGTVTRTLGNGFPGRSSRVKSKAYVPAARLTSPSKVGIGCGVGLVDAVGGALGTAAETGDDGGVGLESPVLAAHALVRSPTAIATMNVHLRV